MDNILTEEEVHIEKDNVEYKGKYKRERIKVWKLVTIDVLFTILCLSVFLLFHYVIPRASATEGKPIIGNNNTYPTFDLPTQETPVKSMEPEITRTPNSSIEKTEHPTNNPIGTATPNNTIITATPNKPISTATPRKTNTPVITHTPEPTAVPLPYEYAKKYEQSPFDRKVMFLDSYKNSSSQIYLRKVEIGEGSNKVTYYVGDVFVSSVQEVKAAFAQSKYGRNIRADLLDIADENNAIFAISGDFYTNTDVGVVIRNGVYYRSVVTDSDICVLFLDGTIKTYNPKDFNIDTVLSQGAWQAWTFGPGLLDGKGGILNSFNCSSYIKQTHPRTSIGYVKPGHYVMVVVDGRDDGYSRGVNLTELAQIMADEGCLSAYNLDGGKTACMSFDGRLVNNPADGGRTIGDIIYIGK